MKLDLREDYIHHKIQYGKYNSTCRAQQSKPLIVGEIFTFEIRYPVKLSHYLLLMLNIS